MRYLDIIAKAQTGEFRIAQAIGCKGYQAMRFKNGAWIFGEILNTNSAKRAIKELKQIKGDHYTYWGI